MIDMRAGLVLVLTLVACGGDDGDDSAPSAPPPAVMTATMPTPPATPACKDVPDGSVTRFVRLSGNCPDLPDEPYDSNNAGGGEGCTATMNETTCVSEARCTVSDENGNTVVLAMRLDASALPVRGTAEIAATDAAGDEVCRSTYSVTIQ